MSIDYDRFMAIRMQPVVASYDWRDCIRYALGIGLGQDPTDAGQLRYVYEENLAVFPTLPLVLALPGFWLRDLDTGIDWRKIVHAGQGAQLHAPLPVAARVTSQSRILSMLDKGADKGALLQTERDVVDADTGVLYATLTQTIMCRGDGGFSGAQRAQPVDKPLAQAAVDSRAPDHVVELATRPEQALYYRLCADLNPLHADPAVAKHAGFDRPILHGLATYGVCTHAVLRAALGYDGSRIASVDARFLSPVFPGESITTEIWCDGDLISFRGRIAARSVNVLSGTIGLRPAASVKAH